MRSTPAWVGAVVCLSAGACSSDPPATGCGPDDVAAIASDVVVVTQVEASLYFAVADPLSSMLTDPSGSPAVSAAATQFPGGCAKASSVANVVTYVLDDCAGPLGLVHATGTVTAKILSLGGGALAIDLSGDNVAANGGVFTLNTSATLTASSDGRKALRATSMSNGQGPQGASVDHTGSFTLLWAPGSSCATLNASLQGFTTGSFGPGTMTIEGYTVCGGGCPSAGTAVDAFRGGTITLAYDGAPYAFCMASDGTSAAIGVLCAGESLTR